VIQAQDPSYDGMGEDKDSDLMRLLPPDVLAHDTDDHIRLIHFLYARLGELGLARLNGSLYRQVYTRDSRGRKIPTRAWK